MAESRQNNDIHINHVYDKMWKKFDERTATEHAAHLLPHLKPDHHILDVGCGRGSITSDLARLVPDGKVLGIDINAKLIEEAKPQAEAQKVSNIEFKAVDANDLSSLPSESFDVIHEHQVLLHVPDPVAVLRELHRILKPGGILSMRDNAAIYWYPMTGFPMMQKYIFESLSHARENKDGVFFGLWNHFAAQEAGFAVDRTVQSSWGWSWKISEELVASAKNSARSLNLARGAMTEAELNQTEREWEEWRQLPQARIQGLDGAVLCWK